ncbi:MAG: hypothetical protein ACQEXJ_02150 [Myxococcota bacterium]
MFQPLLRVTLALSAALFLFACDTVTGEDDDNGGNGPTTTCDYNYQNEDTSKLGIGEECASDDECAFGECMMPGENGNNVNSQFGFCTRGCDCGDEASKIADDNDPVFECVYPSGGEGAWRHVVLQCGSESDCQAFASGWNDCSLPPTGTGTIKRICQAE